MNVRVYDLEKKLKKKDERIAELKYQVDRFKTQEKNASKKKKKTDSTQARQNGMSTSTDAEVIVKVILTRKIKLWFLGP